MVNLCTIPYLQTVMLDRLLATFITSVHLGSKCIAKYKTDYFCAVF